MSVLRSMYKYAVRTMRLSQFIFQRTKGKDEVIETRLVHCSPIIIHVYVLEMQEFFFYSASFLRSLKS